MIYSVQSNGYRGLGFYFFGYLGILQISCEYDYLKYKKKIFSFWVCIWVSLLMIFLIFKVYTQIHTQKLKCFILNYLYQCNLSNIFAKYPTQTQITKKLKTQIQTLTFVFLDASVWVENKIKNVRIVIEKKQKNTRKHGRLWWYNKEYIDSFVVPNYL